MHIEIESTETFSRSGVSSTSGRPYSIREQAALMFRKGEKYPERIKINLEEGAPAYAVGQYTLHDSSFSPNRYGALQVRPILSPVVKQASA